MKRGTSRLAPPTAEPLGRHGIAGTTPLPNLSPDVEPQSFIDRPGAIYKNLIKDNPLVCPHCFQRKKTREKVSKALERYYGEKGRGKGWNRTVDERGRMDSWIDEHFPLDAKHPLLDREFYKTSPIRGRTTKEYLANARAGENKRACTGCGKTYREKSTLSKGEAINAAYTLSCTLQEYGIGHDWVYLIEIVRRLKSINKFAVDDDRLFTKAIREAVQAAQICSVTTDSADTSAAPPAAD